MSDTETTVPLSLAWMQRTQPWTAPYSREFEHSKRGDTDPMFPHMPYLRPEQHRPLTHDLLHVTKAVGILASIAEWADHGNVRLDRVDQAEYEGRIADLVMCALHMANNPPEGYERFDLQTAVVERVERVNRVEWVPAAERSRSAMAFFGGWECGCTATERTVAGIPEFCPVHGEQLVSDDKGRTKVELNHSGVSGYGLRDRNGERIFVERSR